MPHVLIQHQVKRYSDFEAVFLNGAERRKRMGSKGGNVFRNAEDPGNLIILLEWDDAARAKEFVDGFELQEAMEWASSGTASRVTLLEHVLQVET